MVFKEFQEQLKDWQYPVETLPEWDLRERFPYVRDQLTESPSGEIACLLYSITEVTMCNDVGCLAILRQKNAPFLLVNVFRFRFPNQTPVFSSDSRFLFLKSQIYFRKKQKTESPFVLLDLLSGRFALLAGDPCYEEFYVREHADGTFLLGRRTDHRRAWTEEQIQPSDLKWYPFSLMNEPESWQEGWQ